MSDRLGFLYSSAAIREHIYVPRYYAPEIGDRLRALEATHDLVALGTLLDAGHLLVTSGHEIGKMAYGTGPVPFVRTSDISNWEIKADVKQGVSEEWYTRYAARQDVRPGDVLFVRDGTYLVGSCCLVTEADGRLLYQSHILKFRVLPPSALSAPLLLALLSSPIVRRQIAAKRFTADIIDTVGNRYRELVLPVPRDPAKRSRVEQRVSSLIAERVHLRERLRRVPFWAEGLIPDLSVAPPSADAYLDGAGNHGFLMPRSQLRPGIYVPRYYSPHVTARLAELASTHDLVPLGELVERRAVSLSVGAEVGKMAYDTGPIPFIRTSDIASLELKTDPKQSVSEEVFHRYRAAASADPGDILLVRDGTYLVGSSCIVTPYDGPMLFCGGLYRIRVIRRHEVDPYLLLAVLNTPIVRQQVRAKQFARDIIDTLGKRVLELVLPIPKDPELRAELARVTRQAVERRAALRNEARDIALEVERGAPGIGEEDLEAIRLL